MLTVTSYPDVALGVVAGMIPVICWKIWSFVHIPPCSKSRKIASAPIPQLGDDKTLTVWGFQKQGAYPGSHNGVCDGSPYVCRVECYLRFINKPYIKAVSTDLSENPRGMVPFANVYGSMVDDSSRVLEHIQRHFGMDTNKSLTPQQLMHGHFIRRLLAGSFYWVRFYMNFGTEGGREAVRRETGKTVPAPILPLITALIVNSQQARLNGHGLSKLTEEEIIETGKDDLRALSTLLGNSTYILGTKEATVYDTDVYAFVGHLFYDTTPSSLEWVKEIRKELPKLDRYIDQMRSLLFPDLKAKTN